jgi:NAD(P)-dependent dehydrogenase (short-subunit alcohol dehydrogenase family)
MAQNALIVGGSSGLGLELAKILSPEYGVIVTGRRDPEEAGIVFYELELGDGSLSRTPSLKSACSCTQLDSSRKELSAT